MKHFKPYLLPLLLILSAGCRLLPEEPVRGTVNPSAAPSAAQSPVVVKDVSFAKAIQPIFNTQCISCHTPGGIGVGDWRTGQAYKELVNVKSLQDPNQTRVVPGDSAKSLLFLKVSQDTPPVGSRMPLGGTPLSAQEQNLLKTWIDEGAKEN